MHSSRIRNTRSSSHRGCLPQCMLGSPQVWAWRPPQDVGLETHLGVGLEIPPRCGPGDLVWAWRPSQVWAWRPPPARPLNFHPGCGPGDLEGMLGYHTPRDLLQGILGYHLQCMLEYHPPVNRITGTCKNITLPQLRCGW